MLVVLLALEGTALDMIAAVEYGYVYDSGHRCALLVVLVHSRIVG